MGEPRVTDEEAEFACYELLFRVMALVAVVMTVVLVVVIVWALS